MRYEATSSGKLFSTIIHVKTENVDHENILLGGSIEILKNLVKRTILDGLKNGHQVVWNKDTDEQISVFKDKRYSDTLEEHSKTITYMTKTISKNRILEYNIRTVRNPSYVDNPECSHCFRKVIALHESELANSHKKVKVCSKCKEILKIGREIWTKKLGKEVKD